MKYLDFIPSEAVAFEGYACALRGKRDKVMNGPTWEYAQHMRQEGAIRHLGFSTHSVHIAPRFLARVAMGMGMFSISPMYDYTEEPDGGKSEASDRAA